MYILHLFWHKTPYPKDIRVAIDALKIYHRNAIIKMWNDDNIVEYIELFDVQLLHYYNRITIPAAKSDIARLIVLYFFGGVYNDIDDIYGYNFGKKWKTLSNDKIAMFKYRSQWMNGFIMVKRPLHRTIKNMLNIILNNLKTYEQKNTYFNYDITTITGPGIISRLEHDDADNIVEIDKFDTSRWKKINFNTNLPHWSEQQKYYPLMIPKAKM